MLFDVHESLVRRLAREVGVGKRDLEIKTVKIGGVNEVTFVSAKTEDGLEFVREMEEKLPLIELEDYAGIEDVDDELDNPVPDEDDEDLDDDLGEEDE